MNKDAVAGLALVALAGAYWYFANEIPDSTLAGGVGADGLPKALAYVLGGLGLVLFIRALATARAAASTGGGEPAGEVNAMYAHARALGVVIIGSAYIIALPYLGYLLSIGLLMAVMALYSGGRPSLQLFGIAAIGALLFYGLFVRLLKIPLPAGMWPGLQ